MGDKTWWTETCPNCGKETLEHFEQLTSNMKSEDCENCGYTVPWVVDDSKSPITITSLKPYIRQQQGNEMAAPEPLATPESDESAQGTIEDKLKEILNHLYAYSSKKGYLWYIRHRKEYIAQIQAIITTETTKARQSERAWAYKNMRDHGTDPNYVEIAKLRLDRVTGQLAQGGNTDDGSLKIAPVTGEQGE